jgi:hypothetical protein
MKMNLKFALMFGIFLATFTVASAQGRAAEEGGLSRNFERDRNGGCSPSTADHYRDKDVTSKSGLDRIEADRKESARAEAAAAACRDRDRDRAIDRGGKARGRDN